MINNIIAQSNIKELIAETDDDAVEFYRKCGFKIKDLGAVYDNTRRYKCILVKMGSVLI